MCVYKGKNIDIDMETTRGWKYKRGHIVRKCEDKVMSRIAGDLLHGQRKRKS